MVSVPFLEYNAKAFDRFTVARTASETAASTFVSHEESLYGAVVLL